MSEELTRLILEHGRPVKDEEIVGDDWRDYGWDHSGNGCSGWETTAQSEIVGVPFEGGKLITVTHCRCACRIHPHITVGLEGVLHG